MDTLSTKFRDYIREATKLSRASTVITEDNVYQEGNEAIVPFLDKMAAELTLPGSGVDGMEHLEALLAKAEAGAACLLMLEHYSNLDLTLFSWLVRQAGGRGRDIDKALVAIAGMKLTEDNPVVAAFASAYTRIVIYPSRSLAALDGEKDRQELLRSSGINRAAMKALLDIRGRGKIVLVFPSGTRFRPWNPATRRGVREIDSYIKAFDWFCPVAINGEVLHVRQGDMLEDTVSRDVVRVTAGPPVDCTEFRAARRAWAEAAGVEDKKQAVADGVMEMLEKMHTEAEARRKIVAP
jgi:glycerol-3-phosphate O-acyltransferase